MKAWVSIDPNSEQARKLTRSDLAVRFYTGQSVSSGFGKNKSYSYRNGVMTPLGDLEVSQWRELVIALIERNGDKGKLEQLKADAKRFPWLRTAEQIESHALEAYLRLEE